MKSFLKNSFFILPVFLIFVVYLPIVLTMPPFLPKGTTNFSLNQIYITIPFYMGVISFPGYLHMVIMPEDKIINYSRLKKKWLGISLFLSFFACIAGIGLSFHMMPVFSLMGIMIIILILILFLKYRRIKKKREGAEGAEYKKGQVGK